MLKTIWLTIWLFNGQHSVTIEQTKAMYKETRAMYAEAGINLRLKAIKRAYGCSGNALVDNHQESYYCAIMRIRPDKRTLNYTILPPIVESGYSYLAGLAFDSCIYGGVAAGNAIAYRLPEGTPRLHASAVVMAHEIGHLLGASHTNNTTSLMNIGAGALSDTTRQRFIAVDINAFNKCFEKLKNDIAK